MVSQTQAEVGGEGDAGGDVGAGEFLDGDRRLAETAAAAAVGRVHADAGEAELGHAAPVLVGEFGLFVQLGGSGHDFPLRVVTDEVLEHLFFFVEGHVSHGFPPRGFLSGDECSRVAVRGGIL